MMSVPRIAVLLAAYNGVSWLSDQVDSILGQEGVQVTLFISVDRSTDGTEEWCEELQAKYSNVHVLPFGLRFGGASRNFFRLLRDVDLEPYDAISLADQDDIWYVNKLARGYDMMCAQGCDAYSSNVLAFWPDGREMLVEKHQPQVRFDYLFEAAGPGCTYLLTSRLACEFKSFLLGQWQEIQEVTLHDWLIYAYSRSHGKSWYVDPRPSMRYRQHASNQVGVNAGLTAKKARLRQVLSGWWLNQSLRIAELLQVKDSTFVASWSSLNTMALMRLAGASWQCRRRVKDKFLFFGLCIVLIAARITGQKNA